VSVTRRGFLARVAAAAAAVFGLPGLAALLDPAFRGAGGRWVDAGPLDALAEGEPKRFLFPVKAGWETRERAAFLVRKGEQVIALDATCTHAGCSVRIGGASGAFLCPCHGGEFSIEGEPVKKPVTRPLARLETRVEGGQVKVRA
jgi:Rieske Fe-S protein